MVLKPFNMLIQTFNKNLIAFNSKTVLELLNNKTPITDLPFIMHKDLASGHLFLKFGNWGWRKLPISSIKEEYQIIQLINLCKNDIETIQVIKSIIEGK